MESARDRRRLYYSDGAKALAPPSEGMTEDPGVVELPDEVLLRIFQLVDAEHWKAVFQFGYVCRRWRRLSADAELWKHRYIHDFVLSGKLMGRVSQLAVKPRRSHDDLSADEPATAPATAEDDYQRMGRVRRRQRPHQTPQQEDDWDELDMASFGSTGSGESAVVLKQRFESLSPDEIAQLLRELDLVHELVGSWRTMYKETLFLLRERELFPELSPGYWVGEDRGAEPKTHNDFTPHLPHPNTKQLFTPGLNWLGFLEPPRPRTLPPDTILPLLPRMRWPDLTWANFAKLCVPDVWFGRYPHTYYRPVFEPHLPRGHTDVTNPVNYLRAAHCFFFRPYWFFSLLVAGQDPRAPTRMNARMLQLLAPWVFILHSLTLLTLGLMLWTDVLKADSFSWSLLGWERDSEWSGVLLIAMFNCFVTPLIPMVVLDCYPEPPENRFLRWLALSLAVAEALMVFGWGMGLVLALVRVFFGLVVVFGCGFLMMAWMTLMSHGMELWTVSRVVLVVAGEVLLLSLGLFLTWNRFRLWVGLGLSTVFVCVYLPFRVTLNKVRSHQQWTSSSATAMLVRCYVPVTFLGIQFVLACIFFVSYSFWVDYSSF